MGRRNTTNAAFANNLARLMAVRGLTQTALAEHIGVSHAAIQNYLRGRIPRPHIQHKLAEFFRTTVEVLMGDAFIAGMIALWNDEMKAARIGITSDDYNRGFVDAKVSYRFTATKGFPKSVRVSRIPTREMSRLNSEVLSSRDPYPVLLAALPPQYRSDAFLNKLTPFCAEALLDAAFTLNYGEEEGSAILKRIRFVGATS